MGLAPRKPWKRCYLLDGLEGGFVFCCRTPCVAGGRRGALRTCAARVKGSWSVQNGWVHRYHDVARAACPPLQTFPLLARKCNFGDAGAWSRWAVSSSAERDFPVHVRRTCAQRIARLPTPIARALLSSSQAVGSLTDTTYDNHVCMSLATASLFVCLPQVMRETTPFQRLLLVQTLRPDRLVTAMQTFATEALGVPTITPNPVSLGTIVEEVRADRCFSPLHTRHHRPIPLPSPLA